MGGGREILRNSELDITDNTIFPRAYIRTLSKRRIYSRRKKKRKKKVGRIQNFIPGFSFEDKTQIQIFKTLLPRFGKAGLRVSPLFIFPPLLLFFSLALARARRARRISWEANCATTSF